jgi:hypothetical protein
MKKCLLFLLITFSLSFSVFSQNTNQEESNQKLNEVKLNGLYMVLGAFEGSYEYLLNEESGVGVSLFLPIDKDLNEDVNYDISPYYRFYFGEKYASGFFLEGFGMLNSVNEYIYYIGSNQYDEKSITDFALGIGLGGKWLTKKGLLGEINFGIGRNLFNTSDDYIDNEYVAKLGITIGYRF